MSNAKDILNRVYEIVMGKEEQETKVELAQAKTANGEAIFDAEAFEVGNNVFIVTEEGMIPVPVGEYELEDGDLVSVDIGTILNGWVGDSAYTFGLGNVSEAAQQLMRVTKTSLYKGIEQAQVGNRIGDIGWAVQEYTEKQHGYGVVRELTGHGVGKKIHESPEVPNYGKRGSGIKLQEGLVIAIEPMINLGKKDVYVADDDWTIVANDGKVSAHYEHSIAITKQGPDILSSFADIEKNEQANTHLVYPY